MFYSKGYLNSVFDERHLTINNNEIFRCRFVNMHLQKYNGLFSADVINYLDTFQTKKCKIRMSKYLASSQRKDPLHVMIFILPKLL